MEKERERKRQRERERERVGLAQTATTMCVTRFVQGVYKVVYKAFTMCFTGFVESVDAVKSTGIIFRGRSPIYTSRFVSD